jgi:hypothetical protein
MNADHEAFVVLSLEDALSTWLEDVLPFIRWMKEPKGSLVFVLTRAVDQNGNIMSAHGFHSQVAHCLNDQWCCQKA